jgi:hypothetical protein
VAELLTSLEKQRDPIPLAVDGPIERPLATFIGIARDGNPHPVLAGMYNGAIQAMDRSSDLTGSVSLLLQRNPIQRLSP